MSSNYIIKIRDVDMNFVRIKLFFSWWDKTGNWLTLDKGALSYNAGAAYGRPLDGTISAFNVYLYDENQKWGIRLKEFEDFWGINDSGTGTLVQAWCLSMTPRKIKWHIEEEL